MAHAGNVPQLPSAGPHLSTCSTHCVPAVLLILTSPLTYTLPPSHQAPAPQTPGSPGIHSRTAPHRPWQRPSFCFDARFQTPPWLTPYPFSNLSRRPVLTSDPAQLLMHQFLSTCSLPFASLGILWGPQFPASFPPRPTPALTPGPPAAPAGAHWTITRATIRVLGSSLQERVSGRVLQASWKQ